MNLHKVQVYLSPFILNSLNISTIITGAITSSIVSTIFCTGNIGMLNIVLNAGIANITIISKLDIPIAPNNCLFPPIPVLKIDSLLFLILNTCISSENAKTMKVIVWPISTFTCSGLKPSITGTSLVEIPITNAVSESNPIIIPWYAILHVIPFVNIPLSFSIGFLFITSLLAGSNAKASAGRESVTRFIHRI